jgi:hypothetical protein
MGQSARVQSTRRTSPQPRHIRRHEPGDRHLVAYASTRGWLRRARRRSGQIRTSATRWAYALDPELGAVHPAGGRLGDAFEALALAARAWILRFGRSCPWELAVHLTGGLLVAGALHDPP